jgi:hypothetical protein
MNMHYKNPQLGVEYGLRHGMNLRKTVSGKAVMNLGTPTSHMFGNTLQNTPGCMHLEGVQIPKYGENA